MKKTKTIHRERKKSKEVYSRLFTGNQEESSIRPYKYSHPISSSTTYLLAKFSKASTNTFRVLQELVSTLVDTSFLYQHPLVNPHVIFLLSHKYTYLLASDALGGKVFSTVFKAALDKVGVESNEILHLQGG